MSKTLKFKTYCLEAYKFAKGLSGRAAFQLFRKYDVFDYINEFYEPLHSQSLSYIVEDIDEFIDCRRTV